MSVHRPDRHKHLPKESVNMGEYQPPKQGPTISVNIDDWLSASKQVAPSELQRVSDATEYQEALREQWREREEIAQRENRLDKQAVECVECGEIRRHYTGDYMCYQCRDILDGN
jgi:hypothetical protein